MHKKGGCVKITPLIFYVFPKEAFALNIKNLFSGKSQKLSVQFIRYIVVGGIATVADIGVVALTANLFGVAEIASNIFGFTVGLLVNYFISILWVFEKSKLTNRFGEFLIYGAIGLVGLLIRAGIIMALQSIMAVPFFDTWVFAPLNNILRSCTAIVIVLVYNFVARKLLLYRNVKEKEV